MGWHVRLNAMAIAMMEPGDIWKLMFFLMFFGIFLEDKLGFLIDAFDDIWN